MRLKRKYATAIHKGARVGARTARDIEAACEAIEAIWPKL